MCCKRYPKVSMLRKQTSVANTKFEKLLEPYHIGSVKTRNRLIKSGAGLRYRANGDNPVTEKAKVSHESFAKGGVGLIIMESGPAFRGLKG